jgi:hypothetical protein
MDIDYSVIKAILKKLKEMQSPYVSSDEFYLNYLESNCKGFIFHWHLIIENNLISTNKSEIYTISDSGLIPCIQDPLKFTQNIKQLRLTNHGIDFLSSLEKPEITTIILDKFKNEGLSSIIDITKKLAIKTLEKKIDHIIS